MKFTLVLFNAALAVAQVYVDPMSSCTNDCGSSQMPHQTIQAAFDSTTNNQGNIILNSGIYTGDGNKNLRLSSTHTGLVSSTLNPDDVIIDCEGEGQGMFITSASFRQVGGFTIQNCNATMGGAIHMRSVSTEISDVKLINNNATYGGALYLESLSAQFTDVNLTGNSAVNGAAVYCQSASFEFKADGSANVIADNVVDDLGAVFVQDCSFTAANTTIQNNTGGQVSGVYINRGSMNLNNDSAVADNSNGDNAEINLQCYEVQSGITVSDSSFIDERINCINQCRVTKNSEDVCSGDDDGEASSLALPLVTSTFLLMSTLYL